MNKILVDPINTKDCCGKNIRKTPLFVDIKNRHYILEKKVIEGEDPKELKSISKDIMIKCEDIIIYKSKDIDLFYYLIIPYTLQNGIKGYKYIIKQIYELINKHWDIFIPNESSKRYIEQRFTTISLIDKTYKYINEFTLLCQEKQYKLIDVIRSKDNPNLHKAFIDHIYEIEELVENIKDLLYIFEQIEKLVNEKIQEYNNKYNEDIEILDFENSKNNLNRSCNIFEAVLSGNSPKQKDNEEKKETLEKEIKQEYQQEEKDKKHEEISIETEINKIKECVEKIKNIEKYSIFCKAMMYTIDKFRFEDSKMTTIIINDEKIMKILKEILNHNQLDKK